MAKTIQPVIKWTGSKRHVAPYLASLFPSSYVTYIEPFVGGGSMLPYNNRPARAGDILKPLISFWSLIQEHPKYMKETYRDQWERLQKDPDHYYQVRDRFNSIGAGSDFWFLTRTCYNGLIRFNANGDFNVSHHFGRPGIHPDKMDKLVDEWSENYLQHVTFYEGDYRTTIYDVTANDFVFLDPPYVGTQGQYGYDAGQFDYTEFEVYLNELNRIGVKWLLTLGDHDRYDLPEELYVFSQVSPKYNSSFRRMKKQQKSVGDKIYANYTPETIAPIDKPSA